MQTQIEEGLAKHKREHTQRCTLAIVAPTMTTKWPYPRSLSPSPPLSVPLPHVRPLNAPAITVICSLPLYVAGFSVFHFLHRICICTCNCYGFPIESVYECACVCVCVPDTEIVISWNLCEWATAWTGFRLCFQRRSRPGTLPIICLRFRIPSLSFLLKINFMNFENPKSDCDTITCAD